MSEQKVEKNKPSNEKEQKEANGEGVKCDLETDEFEKRWADIEYLIRKQFCCK